MTIKRSQCLTFVPQWLRQLCHRIDAFDERTLLSFSALESTAIVSKSDVVLYYVLNKNIHRLTNGLFHDMDSIVESPQNVTWAENNKDAISEAERVFAKTTLGKIVADPESMPRFTTLVVDATSIILFESVTSRNDSPVNNIVDDVKGFLKALCRHQKFDEYKHLYSFEWVIVHDNSF